MSENFYVVANTEARKYNAGILKIRKAYIMQWYLSKIGPSKVWFAIGLQHLYCFLLFQQKSVNLEFRIKADMASLC